MRGAVTLEPVVAAPEVAASRRAPLCRSRRQPLSFYWRPVACTCQPRARCRANAKATARLSDNFIQTLHVEQACCSPRFFILSFSQFGSFRLEHSGVTAYVERSSFPTC